MSSPPRTFVLLIGAASAFPYPISSNPTQDTLEHNLNLSAANGSTAGYFRLAALPPWSTADAANMVTPVDVSTSAVLTDIVTPIDACSCSITQYELTEITPVPVSESTSSSRTFVTTSSVGPTSTGEAEIAPNTITITDWVTVTLPGPAPNDTGPVTVPISVGPLRCGNMVSRRPEMPGGILGGPAPPKFEQEAAQPER